MSEKYRYERKYLVPLYLEDYLLNLLQSNNANLFEEYVPRQVTSIYFDTLNFSSASQNIDGEPNRLKFRIRHYNKSLSDFKKSIFEIKYKFSSVGYKKFFKLENDFVLNNKLNLNDIFKSNPFPNELKLFYQRLHPSLAVSYFRKYFNSKDRKYRVTFDKNIIYQSIDLISINNPFSYLNSHKEFFSVLEIKYDDDYEINNYLSELKLPLRLSRNSKYVRGLSLLGKINVE